MPYENLDKFRVGTTKNLLTSYAGLSLVADLAKNIGLLNDLDQFVRLKQQRKRYSISEKILSLVLTIIAGGESLDDLRMLNADQGLKKLLGNDNLPASNTIGEFLRQFQRKNIWRLSKINQNLVRNLMRKKNLSSVTVDVDASLIESFKKQAQLTYEGFTGYSPLFAFVRELKLSLLGTFRPGNAAPSGNALSFLKLIFQALPSELEKIYIRSDSAWYNGKVMDYTHEHNARFVIKADQDSAIREVIRAIPETEWSLFEDKEIAETVHTLNKNQYAYRLVILREKANQPDLFDGDYTYFPIITNIDEWPAEKIVHFYRERGECENIIKELQYGFGLGKFPCGQLLANAAYFQIALLAYNLSQALKILTLPSGWFPFTIKTLRFRLLCIAAVIIQHARELILKLPHTYIFNNLFREARWQILGPAAVW